MGRARQNQVDRMTLSLFKALYLDVKVRMKEA